MNTEVPFDVIVVGGSYSGMAAALQLLRARRSVLVVDAGLPRNRFANHSHGFFGQDGSNPRDMLTRAREQLQAYPTLTWIDGVVTRIAGSKDQFTATVVTGQNFHGRRLLFATGVKDSLPEIDGLQERWGKSVFHCPYCHGYELKRGEIGVIATGPMSVHQAQLLLEWGEVTFLTNGIITLNDSTRSELIAGSVKIEEAEIIGIDGVADVLLRNDRRLSFAGLFAASLVSPSSDLAETLGCAIVETPMGTQLQTNDAKETTIPGAFACGDTARLPHSVSLAVADGAWAGAQLHRSLVWPGS